MSIHKKFVVSVLTLLLLKSSVLLAQGIWLPKISIGNIYEVLEEGYWANIYEQEFGVERRAPVILSLDTTHEYSDNVFLRNKNVSRDIITYIKPRIRINIQSLRYLIMFDYRLKIIRYANLDPAPGLDLRDMNYTGHTMNFIIDRIVSKRCKVGLNDRYLSSRRPRDMYLGTNRISRAKFFRNWFSPHIEYYLSERTAIRLNFLYDMLHYQERMGPTDEDSSSYSIETILGHIINEKTQVYFHNRYFIRDYDYSPGYKAYQYLIGLRRAIRPFFWFEIAGGIQVRNFDEEKKGVVENFKKFVALGRIVRETPKSMTEFMFSHFPPDIGEGGSYYTVDRLSFDFFYLPYSKIKIALSLFYEYLNYYHEKGITESGMIEKRKDERYGGDVLLEWEINRNFSISLGYTRLQRDSNLLDADFTANQVILSIKGVFEIW